MGNIRTATYHSTSYSPQQQDERAECENKFRHKLGPVGYKATMPKWERRSKSFMMLGYQIPLKVALRAPETRYGVILIQMIADD
jgi:hypothetical protein